MPEKEITEIIAELLTGVAQKNAFEFAAYLKACGMQFDKGRGYWQDKHYWTIKYRGECVCFILTNGSGNKTDAWVVWSDDSGSNCFADFPLEMRMREIAWQNVDICSNCGGCKNPRGSRKTIFGKDFDSVCITALRFVNPGLESLECAKQMAEIRKNDILKTALCAK